MTEPIEPAVKPPRKPGNRRRTYIFAALCVLAAGTVVASLWSPPPLPEPART